MLDLVSVVTFVIALSSIVSRTCALKNSLQPRARYDHSSLSSHQNIFGDNIINCRAFSIKELKYFKFGGSYDGLNSMPRATVPEVAFVGRSNVGKSSLLNSITGLRKKIAVEGRTPGTTKLINVFHCNDRTGAICSFVDLPGYGYAKISSTRQSCISSFLRDYLLARGALKLVILLIDSRRGPTSDDTDMLQFLLENGHRVVIVATKSDKLNNKDQVDDFSVRAREWCAPVITRTIIAEDEIGVEPSANAMPIILFSASTGAGRADVWHAIHSSLLATE